jgi:hypothetical protein
MAIQSAGPKASLRHHQLGPSEIALFLGNILSAQRQSLERQDARRKHSDIANAKIVTLVREVKAFLRHPEQHVDTIYEKLSEIEHIVDPDQKARSKKHGGPKFESAAGLDRSSARPGRYWTRLTAGGVIYFSWKSSPMSKRISGYPRQLNETYETPPLPFGTRGRLVCAFIEHALQLMPIVAMLLKVDCDSGKTRAYLDCPAFAGKIILLNCIVRFERPGAKRPSDNLWDRQHQDPPTIRYARGPK